MTYKKGVDIQNEMQNFQYQQEMVDYPENLLIRNELQNYGKSEEQIQLEELEKLQQYY